jgi:hypothetical protein
MRAIDAKILEELDMFMVTETVLRPCTIGLEEQKIIGTD